VKIRESTDSVDEYLTIIAIYERAESVWRPGEGKKYHREHTRDGLSLDHAFGMVAGRALGKPVRCERESPVRIRTGHGARLDHHDPYALIPLSNRNNLQ
jgi:hypothetical protein